MQKHENDNNDKTSFSASINLSKFLATFRSCSIHY